MHAEKLSELLRSATGQENYLAWLQSPVTQLFLGALREYGRPRRPDIVVTEAAYLALGESLGWNGAADLIENPAGIAPRASVQPDPSYGADRILGAMRK